MTNKRNRANGEGSIYPYRNGFAAYVWVTTPDGKRRRKYVYGQTREIVHDKWIKLHGQARQRPVPTSTPTVAVYLDRWLKEVVEPEAAPLTYVSYEGTVRLYIVPFLGGKKLDKLSVRDVQTWINTFKKTCLCCLTGKDAQRPAEHKNLRKAQRCCAIGKCCRWLPSRSTVKAARDVLRNALNRAIVEDLVSRNVAGMVKVSGGSDRIHDSWTVDQARRFLEVAKSMVDPLYAAWVLILVLGLRKGEVLGLTWANVDLDSAELKIRKQLQRARGELVHRDTTKTRTSMTTLPLPDICVAALKLRQREQEKAESEAGEMWEKSDFVFTTAYGTPIEPRNFNRSFAGRCQRADVPTIRVHDTRHTCGSLLAALGVHPRVAMQILRHAKFSITMEIYTEIPTEETRRALRDLGKHLGGEVDEAPHDESDDDQIPGEDPDG